MRKGGLNRLESHMRALHVDKLILLPRICKSVKESLDGVPGLVVNEQKVKMEGAIAQMHHVLIEVM